MLQRSPKEPAPQPGVIKSFRTPVKPAPQHQNGQPAPAPTRPAGAPPAPRTGGAVGSAANPSPNPITPVRRAPAATGAQASVDEARARMQQVGPGYTGSVWSKPGSYTAARPAAPAVAAPVTAQPAPAAIRPPQQTEGANPLSGTATTQPEDSTAPIAGVQPQPAAKSLGLATRGAGTPAGQDAAPRDPNVGGSGIYARRFANPQSASTYDQYVRRLFPQNQSTD